MKNALRYTLILVSLLAVFSLACSEFETIKDASKDVTRFGDAMGIGEALESTTCQAQGGTWYKSTKACK